MPLAVPPATTISVPALLTVVPLAVPPAETYSTPPLLTMVPMALPPDSTVSVSACVRTIPLLVWPALTTYRRAEQLVGAAARGDPDGAAAGADSQAAAALHRNAAGRAAEVTTSVPPLLTIVLTAEPRVLDYSWPPLLMTVPIAVR